MTALSTNSPVDYLVAAANSEQLNIYLPVQLNWYIVTTTATGVEEATWSWRY